MLENNLKELGTMLVKAGNTIERQKEEIERLKEENQMLLNENMKLTENKDDILMTAFRLSVNGDFNIVIYDPRTNKSTYFSGGNKFYMKNLGQYESRLIVGINIKRDCENIPLLELVLNF